MILFVEFLLGVSVKVRISTQLVIGGIKIHKIFFGDAIDALLKITSTNLNVLQRRRNCFKIFRIVITTVILSVRHIETATFIYSEKTSKTCFVEINKVSSLLEQIKLNMWNTPDF